MVQDGGRVGKVGWKKLALQVTEGNWEVVVSEASARACASNPPIRHASVGDTNLGATVHQQAPVAELEGWCGRMRVRNEGCTYP
jgi:hypothetical protein